MTTARVAGCGTCGTARLDDAGIDWLRSDFEPGLESTHEMLADLQRGLELCQRTGGP
jgi:formate dehydrogenase assembly factor FdhD